jgi:hypothetical protein
MDRTRIDRIAGFTARKARFNKGKCIAQPAERVQHGSPIAATAGGGRPPVIFFPAPPEVQQVNFEYFDRTAKSVFVVGTFNNWNPKANPLSNVGGGEWSAQILLELGRYEYRFLVDGKWRIDPEAKQQVSDFCGGLSSVVVVE